MHDNEHGGKAAAMEGLFDRLWPLTRSLTGDGVRRTHELLNEIIPLTRIEVPSGTRVFDWTVPPEWILREAYIMDPNGNRILDVADNNLHLMSYSEPYQGKLSRAELDSHLRSLPDQPSAIPYATSYYNRAWGFCLSHEQREALPDGDYQVVVDTDFKEDGSMTLSECVLPGESDREVLISTYTCHPSMANNELSGPLVATFLYQELAALAERRLTYRFVFAPETIGAIAYLNLRGEHLKQHMLAGYVVTCAGDPGPFTYKKSRRGDTVADRAAEYALRARGVEHSVHDFFPTGSDERQYCSPGFDLPVGSLMRSMYGTFPEYHTSLDNRDFISFDALCETVGLYLDMCQALEANRTYVNKVAFGEPQLGKHGLYPATGGGQAIAQDVEDMMWFLNLADGSCDLLSIAARSGVPLDRLDRAARKCLEAEIVETP